MWISTTTTRNNENTYGRKTVSFLSGNFIRIIDIFIVVFKLHYPTLHAEYLSNFILKDMNSINQYSRVSKVRHTEIPSKCHYKELLEIKIFISKPSNQYIMNILPYVVWILMLQCHVKPRKMKIKSALTWNNMLRKSRGNSKARLHMYMYSVGHKLDRFYTGKKNINLTM